MEKNGKHGFIILTQFVTPQQIGTKYSTSGKHKMIKEILVAFQVNFRKFHYLSSRL